MIINPISYPGNKAKVLQDLIPELNSEHKRLVDVFAGSGLVAINTKYDDLYCNDLSKEAMELLKYFYENTSDKIITDVENLIKKYNLTYSRIKPHNYYKIYKHEGLSNYNREGYLKLRNDYNTNPTSDKLFVLLIYGFNHYIRFNKKGQFNVPVGKVDFSKSIYSKTIEFVESIKAKNINFSTYDFRDPALYEIEDAIFYFDPPYLITNAPYNIHWDENDENDLLSILDKLNNENKKFVLSNVLKSNGSKNNLLIEWSKKYQVIVLERQIGRASCRERV